MAIGRRPGAQGLQSLPAQRPNPWPGHPVARGEIPGPLGRLGGSLLSALGERVPQPQRPIPRTAEGSARPLRGNEIRMVFPVFRESLDYSRPRVHNDEFLPFGLQPNNTAMTPNGEMYFNPSRFKEDFALSTDSDKHWFMHEMVHIWQHQLGYPVMRRGAIRIGLDYEYELKPEKRLGDYNMEAQGDLIADWWAIKFLRNPNVMSMKKYKNDLALYETVLTRFIANPSDRKNLP